LTELRGWMDIVKEDTFMSEGLVLDEPDLPQVVVGSPGDLERAQGLLDEINQEIGRLAGIKVRLAGEIADLRCRGKFRFNAPESLDTLA